VFTSDGRLGAVPAEADSCLLSYRHGYLADPDGATDCAPSALSGFSAVIEFKFALLTTSRSHPISWIFFGETALIEPECLQLVRERWLLEE
jgi:hypothetical protein